MVYLHYLGNFYLRPCDLSDINERQVFLDPSLLQLGVVEEEWYPSSCTLPNLVFTNSNLLLGVCL
jgi:hypothetical protein